MRVPDTQIAGLLSLQPSIKLVMLLITIKHLVQRASTVAWNSWVLSAGHAFSRTREHQQEGTTQAIRMVQTLKLKLKLGQLLA